MLKRFSRDHSVISIGELFLTFSSIILHMQDNTIVSLGVKAKSDPGKPERDTGVNKLDLNTVGNYLNLSKSVVLDHSGFGFGASMCAFVGRYSLGDH
jgi:hypothetical protein